MTKNKMFSPGTGNYLLEGTRLAAINSVLLTLGAGMVTCLLWVVERLRQVGVLIPLPVWLILISTAVPYFVMGFQYGKSYGSYIEGRRFLKGYLVGVLGEAPAYILFYTLLNIRLVSITGLEVYRIILVMVGMYAVVFPVMTALGALDQ